MCAAQATEYELKMAKDKMDTDFQRNRLRLGDVDFEYDKQVRAASEGIPDPSVLVSIATVRKDISRALQLRLRLRLRLRLFG